MKYQVRGTSRLLYIIARVGQYLAGWLVAMSRVEIVSERVTSSMVYMKISRYRQSLVGIVIWKGEPRHNELSWSSQALVVSAGGLQ
jgi:hypothetical protein